MGEESDQLRWEIERTRRELGSDVDALGEKVSPRRVMERRVGRARNAVTGIKERVMGTTSDVGSSAGGAVSGAASSVHDTVSGATSSVQNAASSVGDTAAAAAHKARRQTEGNPLAAGLIAFGVGWLASSLLPPSQHERELAQQVKDRAQPAVQQAGQALSEVKDNLQQPAQQAVQSVKGTAADAAGTVKDEARSAAGDVRDQAQDSTQQVRQQTSSR